jgi:hypothetical protein
LKRLKGLKRLREVEGSLERLKRFKGLKIV